MWTILFCIIFLSYTIMCMTLWFLLCELCIDWNEWLWIFFFYLLFIVWSLCCSFIWDLVLGKNYLGSLLICILFGISSQMFKEWIALKKKQIYVSSQWVFWVYWEFWFFFFLLTFFFDDGWHGNVCEMCFSFVHLVFWFVYY